MIQIACGHSNLTILSGTVADDAVADDTILGEDAPEQLPAIHPSASALSIRCFGMTLLSEPSK